MIPANGLGTSRSLHTSQSLSLKRLVFTLLLIYWDIEVKY